MEYNDFGELIKNLRIKNGFTYNDLAYKINLTRITPKTVKKWEYNLEFPDLDMLYKLSEIYQYPCEKLLKAKTDTLQSGVNGIHKRFIRWISFTLGISLYSAIVINYVSIFLAFVFAFSIFYNILKR